LSHFEARKSAHTVRFGWGFGNCMGVRYGWRVKGATPRGGAPLACRAEDNCLQSALETGGLLQLHSVEEELGTHWQRFYPDLSPG